MEYFAVKNLETYQHYHSGRTAAWIKVYHSLLTDYGFSLLDDKQKWPLIAIWLLASRNDNKLPFDVQWVTQNVQVKEPVDLEALERAGFIYRIGIGKKKLPKPEAQGTRTEQGDYMKAVRDKYETKLGSEAIAWAGVAWNKLICKGNPASYIERMASQVLDEFVAEGRTFDFKIAWGKFNRPHNRELANRNLQEKTRNAQTVGDILKEVAGAKPDEAD